MTTVRDVIEQLLYANNLADELEWGNEYIDGPRGAERVRINLHAPGCTVSLDREPNL